MAKRPRILFVSQDGLCRGHMAGGFVQFQAGSLVEFEIAGDPNGKVDPFCQWAMNETGVDISLLTADRLESKSLGSFSHIVHLDGGAAEPAKAPQGVLVERWKLPNPTAVRANPQDLIKVYRALRNEIEVKVRGLLTRALGREPE